MSSRTGWIPSAPSTGSASGAWSVRSARACRVHRDAGHGQRHFLQFHRHLVSSCAVFLIPAVSHSLLPVGRFYRVFRYPHTTRRTVRPHHTIPPRPVRIDHGYAPTGPHNPVYAIPRAGSHRGPSAGTTMRPPSVRGSAAPARRAAMHGCRRAVRPPPAPPVPVRPDAPWMPTVVPSAMCRGPAPPRPGPAPPAADRPNRRPRPPCRSARPPHPPGRRRMPLTAVAFHQLPFEQPFESATPRRASSDGRHHRRGARRPHRPGPAPTSP